MSLKIDTKHLKVGMSYGEDEKGKQQLAELSVLCPRACQSHREVAVDVGKNQKMKNEDLEKV